ncbi:hypothetical protein JL720_13243 [Aureococcus anophagefferens]|nr:hypothetical protein JL720_13243 [Aureococcus anophagefferens]
MELDEAQQKLAAQRQRVVDLLSGAVAEMNLLSSCLDLARGGDFVEATSIAKSARGTAHHAANDAAAARKRLRAPRRSRPPRALTLTRERRAYTAPDVTAKACLGAPRSAEVENDGPLTFAAIGVEVVGVDGPRSLPGAVATFAGDAAFGNRLAALSRDLLENVARSRYAAARGATLVDHVVVRVLDRSSALFVPPRHVIHLRLEEARETAPGGVLARARLSAALARAARGRRGAAANRAGRRRALPPRAPARGPRGARPRVAAPRSPPRRPPLPLGVAPTRLCPGPLVGAAPGEPAFDRASYE